MVRCAPSTFPACGSSVVPRHSGGAPHRPSRSSATGRDGTGGRARGGGNWEGTGKCAWPRWWPEAVWAEVADTNKRVSARQGPVVDGATSVALMH
nr:unnamed protein product [Digitaria exilis]